MKLAIYVHDLNLQIGHSRAMIELINGLSSEEKATISSMEIIAFSAAPLDSLFKNFNCQKNFYKIPFGNVKPFILKMFFYHLCSFWHSIVHAKNHVKIGIGIASLNVDIVNIQFIHKGWENDYFKSTKLGIFKKIYKKILFLYFSICEHYLYSPKNSKAQFIVIANFMKKYMTQTFHTNSENIHLIPSGVNTQEFNFSKYSRLELFQYLVLHYPVLEGLDLNKPIVLFVGAFERKGLNSALEALAEFDACQFIIIGKPESFSTLTIPPSIKSFIISFTKEINLFYEISDLFIFPTKYEPFGLVIIEAYSMGLDLVIPTKNTGASELIIPSEGIFFIDVHENFKILPPVQISMDTKRKRRLERLKNIEKYSWENASKKFYSILSKY